MNMLNFQQNIMSGASFARETNNNNLQFYVNQSSVMEPNSSENHAKDTTTNTTSPTSHSALIHVPSYHPITTSLYANNKREMTLKDRIMKKLSENNNNNQITSAFLPNTQQTTIRNKDQENAFRQIETVHNYAKSSSSPKSSVSSYFDEDDDEDDDDNSEEDDFNYEEDELNVERIESMKKKRANIAVNGLASTNKPIISESSSSFSGGSCYNSSSPSPPSPEANVKTVEQDHHTRRPMNVFLIFCKRHREIVRDKHKTLENRAITKILGEWWAMLDSSEKAPFNDLAKQYKDAFFSENPNFKWHKLPAPPLRSLPSRPKAIERDSSLEYEDVDESMANNDLQELKPHHFELKRVSHTPSVSEVANFKFADETQMGGLSRLIDLSQTHKRPSESDDIERPFLNGFKRKYSSATGETSFSSSDDDSIESKKMKVGRACKGKKYQEMKNSGQIITPTKKSRLLKSSSFSSGSADDIKSPRKSVPPVNVETHSFELYDRIKALPALDYDEYLQKKKTSKKNKKINSKKKSGGVKQSQAIAIPKQQPSAEELKAAALAAKTKMQMVGSQKRKARKESITRRNVDEFQKVIVNIQTMPDGGTYPVAQIAPSSTTSDLDILAEVATHRELLGNYS